MGNQKRFKLYKSGKFWVTAAIGLAALTGATPAAQADQVASNVEATQTVDVAPVEKEVTLSAPEVTPEAVAPDTTPEPEVEAEVETDAETPEVDVEAAKDDEAAKPEADQPTVEVSEPEIKKTPKPEAKPLAGWQGQKYYENGQAVKGAKQIDDRDYYFDEQGNAVTGFLKLNNGRQLQFYRADFTRVNNAYHTADGHVYYFDEQGNAVTGLRRYDKGLEAYDRDFKRIHNKYLDVNKRDRYFFDEKGQAVQGLRWYDNGKKLEYYGNDYKQYRGRYLDLNKQDRYYFKEDGDALKGLRWYNHGKLLEYYGNDYKQYRGRYLDLNKQDRYYFKEDGDALKGMRWYNNGKLLEYYGNDYKQYRGRYLDLNKQDRYYFKADGDALKGLRWYANGKKLEYYGNDYKQYRGRYLDLNKQDRYYFKADGDAHQGFRWYQKNTKLEYYGSDFKQLRGKHLKATPQYTYYFKEDGDALEGIRWYDGGKQAEFFGRDYAQIRNRWMNHKGTSLYFDHAGKLNGSKLNFKYYSQLVQGAPQGCEGTSLQMALSAKGRYLSLQQIYRELGFGYNVSPSQGFFGNPWGHGGAKTETVFAEPMARKLGKYGVANLTGANRYDIIKELNRGNGIVTWADYNWRPGSAYHVMSIVGYQNGRFLIADPWGYAGQGPRTYWLDMGTWEYVNRTSQPKGYQGPRSMNLVVR